MALQLKSLAEAVDGRGVKLAIYGESGTGKTTQIAALMAILGDGEELLVITSEHGLRTLAQEHFGLMKDKRLVVAECGKMSEVREAVELAKSGRFAWVVVDSVSNIADRELRAMLELKPDPRQAYGEVMLRIPNMLWALVDVAGLNVLFVFQEERIERNEGTTKNPDMVDYFAPVVPSKALKQQMPYVFDGLLRLEMKLDGSRWFRTVRTRTIIAKDRTGKLDPEGEEPDIGAIVTKILS
jgi:hypothetical protein